MFGSRFLCLCIAAALLALTATSSAWSQTPPPSSLEGPVDTTCKVYSLAGLGDEAFCKWVVETIPELVQPASWKGTAAEGKTRLKYHAPSKILVINQTPAVHAKVDEFLQNLRKTAPAASAKPMHDAQVVPAQFVAPDGARPVQPAVQSSYPVPALPQTPKHLFHFIIRYEGEGIIDSNVVKFTKAMSKDSSSSANRAYVPTPVPAPPPMVVPPSTFGTPLNAVPASPTAGSWQPAPAPTPSGPRRMPPADAPTDEPTPLPPPPPPPPPPPLPF